jgi:hypothetical protein
VAAHAVAGIDARDAQQRHPAARLPAEAAHLRFGVHTAVGAVRTRRHRARFIEGRAAAVAIDTRGAAVDQPLHPSTAGQRAQQVGGARVGAALVRRRRQVQHAVGQRAQAPQAGGVVKVTQHGHCAQLSQGLHAAGRRGQRQHSPAWHQELQYPHAHVATAHDEQGGQAHSHGGRWHVGRAVWLGGRGTIPDEFTWAPHASRASRATNAASHDLSDHPPARQPQL